MFHKLFRATQNIELPPWGRYATGIIYLDQETHSESEKEFVALAESLNLKIIAWRTVPVDRTAIGQVANKSEPLSRQVFITGDALDDKALKLQVITVFCTTISD